VQTSIRIKFNIDLGLCAASRRWSKRRTPNYLSSRRAGNSAGIHSQPGLWFGTPGNHAGGQQIMLGRAEVVLAGGTESMSRVPVFRCQAQRAAWHGKYRTRDMLSVPPASTTSARPNMICWAASMIAWSPEPQAWLTVNAGTVSGTPARKVIWRATFGPPPACRAQPQIDC